MHDSASISRPLSASLLEKSHPSFSYFRRFGDGGPRGSGVFLMDSRVDFKLFQSSSLVDRMTSTKMLPRYPG